MTKVAKFGPNVFAVVLAAGESRRFGRLKQLALIDQEALVHKASRVARESCGINTAIVLGHRAWEVYLGSEGECRFMVLNDRYSKGIGTSIALAANTIGRVADALLFVLADQPLVTSEHLQTMMTAWSRDDTHIVASSYDGVSGPPILMPRGTYESLRKLTGDNGAKALLADRRFTVTSVHLGRNGIDIDRAEDLLRLNQAAE